MEGQGMRKKGLAVLLSAGLLAALPGLAAADSTKDCGTTATSPNNNGQGTPFVTTTTQTSSCNSNSDTGQTTTTTNRGGHPK
jgi:hypothetical protein